MAVSVSEQSGHAPIAELRRTDIVEAARSLYERKGIGSTSVKDIAAEVGVTRSLFYHYFENKDDVTEAVLDTYVQDFVELVRHWNASRELGNVRKALSESIKVIRRGLFDNNSLRKDLANNENAGLYLKFASRVSEALARYITDTTVVDYAQYHEIEIDHVFETFYVLISGLVSYMRYNPEVSDEVLADIVAQTLRLDLDYVPGGSKVAPCATGAAPR